jgi:hypothetical protein
VEYQRRLCEILHSGLDGQRHHSGLHLLHDAAVDTQHRSVGGRARFVEHSEHAHDDGVLQRREAVLSEGRVVSVAAVVLHVEPDLWGYLEQLATTNDATTVPAKVSETGLSELAGLPSNVSGFARAIIKLRDTYAPNVIVGYHISVWGTGTDIALSNPPDATVDALGAKAAAFYNSLGANFDVAFAEFSDRDSGFYQYVYGNPNAWWDSEDFRRNVKFLGDFSTATNKRIVMWQIPLGNTKMRAQNNTTGHYQDNRPEWLLDEPARTHLSAYRDAGVVAFLFGGGAGGTSCACDGQNDGVTNPAAVNGNSFVSAAGTGAPSFNGTTLTTPYAANDDGGFFRWKAWQYYQTGAIPLSSVAPAAPTNLRIVP